MNTEPPPILEPNPGKHATPAAPVSLSRLGMWLSLVAPVVILLFLASKPGWGSPITILGGLCFFFVPPAAFILSTIGLVRGQDRVAAILGMVLSGLCVLFLFGMPLLTMLCR